MSDEQQSVAGQDDAALASRRGWMSSRRGLLKTASGLAAVGVIGTGLAETGTARASETVPGGASASGRGAALSLNFTMPPFWVEIEGAKQGKFKGDSGKAADYKIFGGGFHYDVVSPRDPASGLPTGKRQHRPIVITKEWGAATPQLFQALVTNENLNSVTFSFFSVRRTAGTVDNAASSSVDYTIKLTNASLANFEQYIHFSAEGHPNSDEALRLEDVSFTFQHIEITSNVGKTTASDDWESSNP